ncbi:MAG: energy-coupling factor ABC transporter ATP-binding protein [Victivallaceae bacterium]|nr:energy-coupling factor ABC transporter ATP-binding protein [Victivallaceae bacterium]
MKIEFQEVSVVRSGGVTALDRVSCVIEGGAEASTAVLGANGAGKSTFLEAVLGLCPPTSGNILVDGLTAGRHHTGTIRRRIGMVFQNADDQLFSQTVAEDTAFGPHNLGLPPEEVDTRVTAALRELGISHLAGRDVNKLSGGEKRRAALAGVLAMHPEALFLDEPTSMLDPRGARELAALLNSLPNLKVVATHDLPFARATCRQCVILADGAVRARGTTAELLARHDLLRECGLE